MTTTLPNAEELRAEVREWLRSNWSPLPKADDPWTSSPERIAWLEKVLDAGYAVPTYPAEWFGREYPGELAAVIAQEFAAIKAPGSRQDKYNIPANTTLKLGTDSLKRGLLRAFLVERHAGVQPASRGVGELCPRLVHRQDVLPAGVQARPDRRKQLGASEGRAGMGAGTATGQARRDRVGGRSDRRPVGTRGHTLVTS